MTEHDKIADCPTKKSWGEIWNGVLKKFVWRAADGLGEETGRSFGILLRWTAAAVLLVVVAGSIIGSFTGWFGTLFDWLPSWPSFGGEESAAAAPPPPVQTAPDCTHWQHSWAPGWLTPCK